MSDIHSCSYHCNRPECIKAQRDELRERLAQPEQEPVAWIDEFGNVFPLGAQRGPKHLNEPMKPLYTAPPQRKPLTDDECDAIYDALDVWARDVDASEFGLPAWAGGGMEAGRAIIRAAHGIKENT